MNAPERIPPLAKRRITALLILIAIAGFAGISAVVYFLSIFDLDKVALIFAAITGIFLLEIIALVANRLLDNPIPQKLVVSVFAVLMGVGLVTAILS